MIKSIFYSVFFTAILTITSVSNGQEFTLMVGTQASEASINGNTLEIVNSGRLHTYERDASLDSADGQFVGFYNESLRKGLRFPNSGQGKMQTTDGYGNWKWTQMTVHSGKVAPAPNPQYGSSPTPRIDNIIDLFGQLNPDRKPRQQTRQPCSRPNRINDPFVGSWRSSQADGSYVTVEFWSNQFKITEFDDFGDEIGNLPGRYKVFTKPNGKEGLKIEDESGNFHEAEGKVNKDKSKLKFWNVVWEKV